MNIYKLSQGVNNGYDTYDSCVVIASTPEAAKRVHPLNINTYPHIFLYDEEKKKFYKVGTSKEGSWGCWIDNLDDIQVELIGVASPEYDKEQVICASFNAG